MPEGVAYATLAGLPPQVGIYGYLLGGLGYALFGSSRHLAIGPTSAISLMVGASVAPLAMGKAVPPSRWFQLFWWMMLKLKEAASEFGIKGSANILARTEPLWGLHSTVQDADGKPLPKIAINFHHFSYRNDDALRSKDAGRLLDFREWREF